MPILESKNALSRIKWTFLVYSNRQTRIEYGCFPQDVCYKMRSLVINRFFEEEVWLQV
jgi:hypothetical protein